MMKEYCPYNVPRRNEKTGIINKCDMCLERVEAGHGADVRKNMSDRSHEFR